MSVSYLNNKVFKLFINRRCSTTKEISLLKYIFLIIAYVDHLIKAYFVNRSKLSVKYLYVAHP